MMVSLNKSMEELPLIISNHGLEMLPCVCGEHSKYYTNGKDILLITSVPCGSLTTVHVNKELLKEIENN